MNEFPDYWRRRRRRWPTSAALTDAQPAAAAQFAWSSGARLVDYVSDKGDKLQGALYLPANYEPGKKYPTVAYIYEKLSQNLHRFCAPERDGAALQPGDLHEPRLRGVRCRTSSTR